MKRKMPKIAKKPAVPKKVPAKRAPNVSPQDQALYDRVMVIARQNIYGDPGDDARYKIVLQRLAGGKAELAATIGRITGTILANIQGALQKGGKSVPNYILLHAGLEIIADLAEISVAAKLADQAQVQAITKEAALTAVQTFKAAQASIGAQSGQNGQPAPEAPPTQAAPPAASPQPPAPGIVNAARA